MYKYSHPYHLVNNSPWPFIVSLISLDLFLSIINIIYNKIGSSFILIWTIISLFISVTIWIKEIINESIYKGEHTKIVSKNILTGYILFIISEVLIFFSLFFAYFYNSLIPSIEIGSEWPPIGIDVLNPLSIPLYNTVILYISGLTITISQNLINKRNKKESMLYLYITILLGLIFSYFQYIEYYWASYTISESIYSTNFYILTGFHGIHVIIGTILLIITIIRLYNYHFTNKNPIGFISSSIYWHFVDYVWLILFACVYCWSH